MAKVFFCHPVSKHEQCANGNDAVLWAPQIFLFTARFISGIGQPLYSTLGISYMDDNIQKSKTPAFVSKFWSFSAIRTKKLKWIVIAKSFIHVFFRFFNVYANAGTSTRIHVGIDELKIVHFAIVDTDNKRFGSALVGCLVAWMGHFSNFIDSVDFILRYLSRIRLEISINKKCIKILFMLLV